MSVLVEVVFTQRVFRWLGFGLLGCVRFRNDLRRRRFRFCLPFTGHDNEDFKRAPQCADTQHVAGPVQWAAYGDVYSKDHDKGAEANQKTSHQALGKSLVHARKREPVFPVAQPLSACFNVNSFLLPWRAGET